MEDITRALEKLQAYVEREGYRGYDPYDVLNARIPFRRLGKWGPVLAIQVQKRNPFNIRPLLGIKKGHNPKGMGLLLQAYATRYAHTGDAADLEKARYLFDWLRNNPSKGYSGYGWGYNFDWASPVKYLPAYTPSIVVTGFVGQGIFRYHEVTGDPRAAEVLRSACDFVLNDLSRVTTDDGLCFSYTPIMQDCCYNASMLGAELFAKVYSITGEAHLREMAVQAIDFVTAHQYDDGHWNYSIDLETGQERTQIDFHQGFVLDSLQACMTYASLEDVRYTEALRRGAAYYDREQFFPDGRSKWRLPKEWPVEIHNQAQGILTFARLAHLDPAYLARAEGIARWTIRHMQDREGFFYYRKNRYHMNRISYMRWSQAWMMLALAELAAVKARHAKAVLTQL